MEKNHKSEVNRLNIKVRNLTSEKEDLENAMKELESKLQVGFKLRHGHS